VGGLQMPAKTARSSADEVTASCVYAGYQPDAQRTIITDAAPCLAGKVQSEQQFPYRGLEISLILLTYRLAVASAHAARTPWSSVRPPVRPCSRQATMLGMWRASL
jgi:hypothetical protein